MSFSPGDIVRLAFNPSVKVTVVSKQNGQYRCRVDDFYNPDRCEDFAAADLMPVLKNGRHKNIHNNP